MSADISDLPSRSENMESLKRTGYTVDAEWFDKLPIAYHTQYHFYRCIPCLRPLSNLRNHFLSSGPDGSEYKSSLKAIPALHKRYPEHDPNELLPRSLSTFNPVPTHIAGIYTCEGYACNLCDYCGERKNTIEDISILPMM
jgi:hypothetical protein